MPTLTSGATTDKDKAISLRIVLNPLFHGLTGLPFAPKSKDARRL
jgi:hypothetical protein